MFPTRAWGSVLAMQTTTTTVIRAATRDDIPGFRRRGIASAMLTPRREARP
jgi:hypothetical protein